MPRRRRGLLEWCLLLGVGRIRVLLSGRLLRLVWWLLVFVLLRLLGVDRV